MGFSLGGLINSVTGATNTAQRQQDYAVHMNKLNFEQQKYFAQNAHQMEMEDLRKAGLNPALTATGGSGASASGGGGSTGTGGASGSGNPFDILNTIVGMSNQTSATNSQNEVNRAQAIKLIAEAKNIPYQNKIAMMNALSGKMTAEANATNASVNKNTKWEIPGFFKNLGNGYKEPTEEERKKGHLY